MSDKYDYWEMLKAADTYDMGFLDVHILDVGGGYWISTTPRFVDGMTYEHRDEIGKDIYRAIRQHEGEGGE